MLSYIKKSLARLFTQPTHLERFILSKNPQSPADVDHWLEVYSRSQSERFV